MAETSDISWEIIAKISDPEYRARRDVIDFAARSLHDHLNAFLNTRKRIGAPDWTLNTNTDQILRRSPGQDSSIRHMQGSRCARSVAVLTYCDIRLLQQNGVCNYETQRL
jgi:hypothetical protein